MIRFGPAGWDYKDWAGIVYPKPAPKGFDPLAWLAGYFDTVEVNATFYRPLPAKLARGWCERVAANREFRFGVKLFRRFTHERDAAFGAAEVAEARALYDALAAERRLGAVLVQYPWSFKNEEPSRERLREVLAAFSGLPLVVEVRHESWNRPDVFEELAERGAGFVNVDQPLFERSLRPSAVATARVGYIRVHGRNFKDWFRAGAGRDARYDYLYTAGELEPWAERAVALEEEPATDEVYVVTNNHFEGKAAANALMLASMVRRRKVSAPPALVERYREVLAPFARAEADGGAPGPLFGGAMSSASTDDGST
jgi:uncharacterized protein YecE (DUF72 family)